MGPKRVPSSEADGFLEKKPKPIPRNLVSTPQRTHPPRPSVVSLAQLPTDILKWILKHVQQADMMSLSLTSKSLYWLTCERLYQNVVISHDEYEMLLMPNLNHHSYVPIRQKEKFLSTVAGNKRLARLIKSLKIEESMCKYDCGDFATYIPALLSHLRLEFFHCLERVNLPQRLIQTVRRMSTYLVRDNVFPSNIVELRINYRSGDRELFESLAFDMISHKTYRTLKKLYFHTIDYEIFFGAVPRSDVLENEMPFWSCFFFILSDSDIILNLTALGIDGEFWDTDDDLTIESVSEVVRLDKLETLDLKYSQYVRDHGEKIHKDGVHYLLNAITRKTFRLRNLTIIHTKPVSRDEIKALARVLQYNIPDQLKQLRVTFEDQSQGESELIRRTIVIFQQNLVKLKFEYDPWRLGERPRKFSGVPALRSLHKEITDQIGMREDLAPSIHDYEDSRPYVDKSFFTTITSHKEEILKYLQSDSIYRSAAQQLPLLKEYFVVGLYIDMKKRHILLNGRFISLQRGTPVTGVEKRTICEEGF